MKIRKVAAPVFFSLYITNRCNLRCSYCFIHDPAVDPELLKAEFSLDEAKTLIDQAYELGTRMIFLLGGEPLMYPHLGEILAYIRSKGMVCHVLTNGTLITKHIKELQLTDGICISLDGPKEANDACRGEGVFDKTLENLNAAIEAGLKCRLHAVLNRHNLQRLQEFLTTAAKLGTPVTVSSPAYVDHEGHEELALSEEEQRSFWKELKRFKDKGLPVGHTTGVLETMINWPVSYGQPLMTKDFNAHQGFDPVRCVNTEYYCGVYADGTLHFCLRPGMPSGLNVKEVGLAKAWEHLKTLRPNCHVCANPDLLEYSMATRLRMQGVLNALRHQLLKKY